MYKLIYKSQFVAGFDEDQVLGNLAQLLQLKPKTIRLVFFSGRPSVIKIVESGTDVDQWRAAFLDAGVYLDVVSITAPDAESLADQIELELELHSLESDLDEDEEPPRQFLVQKIIAPPEEPEASVPTTAPTTVAPEISLALPNAEQNAKASSKAPQSTEIATPQNEELAEKVELSSESLPINKKEKAAASAKVVKAETPVAPSSSPLVITNTESAPVEAVISDEPKTLSPTEAKHKDANKSGALVDEVTLPSAGEKSEDEATAESIVSEKNDELDDHSIDEHVDVNWHKSSFLWGMLVIVMAIAITASTILWLKRPLWVEVTASPQANKIVDALATESLSALAYIDVKRLQQLPDVLQKDSGMKHFPAPAPDFWRGLEQSGVDISTQLKHAWVAAYQSDNQTQSVWVLSGKFNSEKVREWLKKSYVIDEDTAQQVVFSLVDKNTCEKQPAMMAVIQPDRILLGAPGHVAAFRGRIDAGAPPARDLADWQRISAAQMLTIALFDPARFGNPSTTLAFNKLAIDAGPVKGIYFGIAPRLLPPALEFSAIMVGAEPQFVNATKDTLVVALTNAKKAFANDWPETLPLYERMKLSQSDQQLQATVLFDELIQQRLQVWGQSLFAQPFPINASAPVDITQERIDEKPRKFDNLSSLEIPEFAQNRHLNNSFAAQNSVGPFGVGISSIEATEQGVAITLDVNAFNLPNLGKDADSIRLKITDIVDHQDQSLMDNLTCAPNGMRDVAHINAVYEGSFFDQGQSQSYIGIQGTKRILLPENINISSIGAIKGEIEYQLPTKVERLVVKAPLTGKVVESHGMQLRFLSAGAGSVKFMQEGNPDALLQVNALNADSKVLASVNRQQGEAFLNSVPTQLDVQGGVAAAEIIVASNIEKKVYQFSFGRIQPPEKTFVLDKPEPEFLNAAKLTALKQDSAPTDIKYPYQTPQQTVTAGPALIAVNQLNIYEQKLSLAADIYLRNQHALTRQLSAVRLMITEVEDSSGNIHPVNIQVPVALEHQGGIWVEGSYQPDPAQPWLRGQLDLREQELGVSDVVAFWGKLVFLAPGEPIPIPVPFQFGMQWNGSGSSLKLARWEAGRMLFDIHGNFSELMAITARDDTGTVISQAAELRSSLGVNQVEIAVKQRPAVIEFSIARDQQTAEFPFEIRAAQ